MRSARGPRVNAEALNAFRRLAGIDQTKLSQRTAQLGRRISPSHISRLESGARKWPSIGITRTLAAALGVEVESLITVERIGGQR